MGLNNGRCPKVGYTFSDNSGKNGKKRNLKVISNNQTEVRGYVVVEDLKTAEQFLYPIKAIPGYGERPSLIFTVSSDKNEEVKSPPLWGFSGSRLYLSRYGVVKKEHLSLFDIIGNEKAIEHKPDSAPVILGYDYCAKLIRDGYLYVFEELGADGAKYAAYEYQVINGQITLNLWTTDAKKQKQDTREAKNKIDLFDFHEISDEAERVWTAFSDVQWSFDYASKMLNGKDPKSKEWREQRFTKLELNPWYTEYENDVKTQNNSTAYTFTGGLPFYGIQWITEKGSRAASRIRSYWENDSHITSKNIENENRNKKSLTIYCPVDDPIGCAYDIVEDLDRLYNQLEARIVAMSSGKSYEEVLNAIENGDELQTNYSEEEERQFNSMFLMAVSIFNLLSDQENKDLDDCREAIQLDKILKLLAVDERQQIKDQIMGKRLSGPSMRDALGDLLSSNYYQNVLNDYYFNTLDNMLTGEAIVLLHYGKLRKKPHDIDNIINITRASFKQAAKEEEEDKWADFLYESFYKDVPDSLDEPLLGSKQGKDIRMTPYIYHKDVEIPDPDPADAPDLDGGINTGKPGMMKLSTKVALKAALNTNTAFGMYSNHLMSHVRCKADDFLKWEKKIDRTISKVKAEEVTRVEDVIARYNEWEKEFYPSSKYDGKGKDNVLGRSRRWAKEKWNKLARSKEPAAMQSKAQGQIDKIRNKSAIRIEKLESSKITRKIKVFSFIRFKEMKDKNLHKYPPFRAMIVLIQIYNFTMAIKAGCDNVNIRNIASAWGTGFSLTSVITSWIVDYKKQTERLPVAELMEKTSIQEYASKSTWGARFKAVKMYTKIGWGGSAVMIVVSGMDVTDRLSANDNDAAFWYGVSAAASAGSLGVSVYLATAVAAGGWVPVLGWILLGVGLVATGMAVWLTDTPFESFLKNSVFGTYKEIEGVAGWTPDGVKYELYNNRQAYANNGHLKERGKEIDLADMECMFGWLHDFLSNFRFEICKQTRPLLNDTAVKVGATAVKYCYGFGVGFEFGGAIPGKSVLEYHLLIYPYGLEKPEYMFETVGNDNRDLISPIDVKKSLFVIDDEKKCCTGEISFTFGNSLFEFDETGKKRKPLFSKRMIAVFYCRLVVDKDRGLYWPFQGDEDHVYAASFALLTCPKPNSAYFNQSLTQSQVRIGTLDMILDEAKAFQDKYVQQ